MANESRNRASSASPGEAGIDEAGVPNVYYDRQFNTQAAKILPGEYYATKRDMMIVTVLGSCVSACIRDRETGIWKRKCDLREAIEGVFNFHCV